MLPSSGSSFVGVLAGRFAAVGMLAYAFGKDLVRHPWQLGLSVLGVGLGVAVILAMELASESAHRGFEVANEAVMGPATHILKGSDMGVRRDVLRLVRRSGLAEMAAPVVEAQVEIDGHKVRLLGVDPLTELRAQRLFGRSARSGSAQRNIAPIEFLASSKGSLVTPATATALGLTVGDPFVIGLAGRSFGLILTGYLGSGDDLEGFGGLIVVDVMTAGRIVGRSRHYTRIDLILSSTTNARSLAQILPPDTRVTSVGNQVNTRRQVTRAFELNLRMMTLLTTAVGILLICSTAYISVTRRRDTLAMFRALGVAREEIFCAFLLEAWVLGLAGALLGVLAGYPLAYAMLALVTRTMEDLYFVGVVRALEFDSALIAVGLAIGAGTTVLGSAYPLYRASETLPRLTFTRSGSPFSSRRVLWGTSAVAIASLSVGFAFVGYRPALGSPGLAVGYVGLSATIVGCGLLVPVGSAGLLFAIRRVSRRLPNLPLALAIAGLQAHLVRVNIAGIALMISVAATVGVGLMVDSFRYAVQDWLSAALPADVYLTVPSESARLPPTLMSALPDIEGVDAVSLGLWTRVQSSNGSVRVFALSPAPRSRGSFPLVERSPQVWSRFLTGSGVLVSEPLAFKENLRVGSIFNFLAEAGASELPVLGIFRDYRSESGFVLIHRTAFDRLWPKDASARGYTGVGIFLSGSGKENPRATLEAIKRVLRNQALFPQIRSNDELRDYSLRVFERTFVVTEVLRWVTAAVAFLAVLGSTLALEVERAPERALLRALGLTRAQIGSTIGFECLLQGLLAGILAIPTGILLSWLLIEVVNRRSFGWSMDLHLEPGVFVFAVVSAAVASVLAGLYPARRAAIASPGATLRFD